MPRRDDLRKILILGSGPIVIGQACEFDYSGTQACKALKDEGYEVILVNSNPATIMTDPEIADRTYVEPLTVEYLEKIIATERPDAMLPTVGGQTALNLAVELTDAGVLEKHGVELIGASPEAIRIAEDRLEFKQTVARIGKPLQGGACGRRQVVALQGGIRPLEEARLVFRVEERAVRVGTGGVVLTVCAQDRAIHGSLHHWLGVLGSNGIRATKARLPGSRSRCQICCSTRRRTLRRPASSRSSSKESRAASATSGRSHLCAASTCR